jgi:hypothetical protein
VSAPIILACICKNRRHGGLTWQHLSARDLGAEVGAMDLGAYLAEVRVYKYTGSAVSSFYSFLFFQTPNST